VAAIEESQNQACLNISGGYRSMPESRNGLLDQLKDKGEVGYLLEEMLIKAGFRYHEK